MGKKKSGPLFLDTSIQIARVVHGPKTKERIRNRIAQHDQTSTGLVSRQEFKRRLLKEAEYLLRILNKYNSFDEVNQHVIRLWGQWPGRVRKRNICLQTLAQVHGGDDKERTERLSLYLRSLLVAGLKRFDQQVDSVRQDANCACARADVVEKVPLRKYNFGPDRCSDTRPGQCGVVAFLQTRTDACKMILEKIRSLKPAEKTNDLTQAEEFLQEILFHPEKAVSYNPCLSTGDLLIALESLGIESFYTLNSAESQHLCRALKQTLIVRPDPLKEDVVCPQQEKKWPDFGQQEKSSAKDASPKIDN